MPIKRHNADLTSFAALLGDSFASKINLLTQIIQEHHYPSLGRYKERLLANIIAEYLPKNYEVGTGFVLFVHEATSERAKKPGFDAMNMGSHSISKQCDIIVFDSSKIPVVFRDGDFVVVRPESVKAIVEVKGMANANVISEALNGFYDFGQKWRQCQIFYNEHHQALTRCPSLYVMCWDVSVAKNGRPVTNGTKIAKQVADFYKKNMKLDELKGFPRLDKILIYNECEIGKIGYSEIGTTSFEEGYATDSGKFLRHDTKGAAYRSGDRTVASLLAALHSTVCEEFNRFYSYTDETRDNVPHAEWLKTYSPWLTEDGYIRDANTDFVIDRR